MEKIRKRLFSLFVFLTLIIVAGIFITTALFKMNALFKITYMSAFALMAVFVLLMLMLCYFYPFWKANFTKRKTMGILIAFTVIPRLLWIIFVDTQPSSDFGHLHDYAVSAAAGNFDDYVDFYAIFPHKFSYGLLLALIYKILGVNLLAVKILNVILSVCLVLIIHWMGKMLFNERTGRIAGMIAALWPAQIMYTSVLASEHVFIVFFLLGLALLIRYHNKISEKAAMPGLAAAGASLAVSQTIRPVSVIVFPVLLIYLFIFVRYSAGKLKGLLQKGKVLGVFAAGFLLMMAFISIPVWKLTGMQLWNTSSGYNLMIGTNFESKGMWNAEDHSIIKEFNFDSEKVHSEAQKRAIERIKSDPLKFGVLAVEKFGVLWMDETYGYYWSQDKLGQENAVQGFVNSHPRLFAVLAQYYYLFILFFVSIGLYFTRKNSVQFVSVFIMIFLGFVAAHTFIEVQARYHFPVMPLFMLISGYGIERLTLRWRKG